MALRSEIKTQYPDYHAAPVGAWGDPRPRILIVGLAPGLHGAARTGKAFVGDASGRFLFAALHRAGLASAAEPERAQLQGVRITNVVKCLPPGNAPNAAEMSACADYLQDEMQRYFSPRVRTPRVLISLGGSAHRAVCRSLGVSGAGFCHAGVTEVSPRRHIVSSYHPSRLNVNTGRLTEDMLDEVFSMALTRLDPHLDR